MYSYPIDYELFTTEEISILVDFLALIEDANEHKANPEKLKKRYKEFRNIINSQAIEKQIDRDFMKSSGYSIYKTMQKYK